MIKEQDIKAGYFCFSTHVNSPGVDIVNILKETSKALQVQHEYYKRPVWIPKSSLQVIPGTGAYTLGVGFRKLLQRQRNDYPFKALGVIL